MENKTKKKYVSYFVQVSENHNAMKDSKNCFFPSSENPKSKFTCQEKLPPLLHENDVLLKPWESNFWIETNHGGTIG